jgi:hypothetical protein
VQRAVGGTPAEITREWMQDAPHLAVVHESELGRIGLILLPMFDVEVLADGKGRLANEMERALDLAAQSGARVVSLTGVIPSVTRYGRELEHLAGALALTTGHATTAATVALTVERCLREAHRELVSSRVAFLGLGSIGTAVLHLLLERFPHPAEIVLCDVYGRAGELERMSDEVSVRFHFAGPIHIASFARRSARATVLGGSDHRRYDGAPRARRRPLGARDYPRRRFCAALLFRGERDAPAHFPRRRPALRGRARQRALGL